jgi:NADPH-dependent curcumin reductase CurA
MVSAVRNEVASRIADGRIRYREDITDGLENALATFIGMLRGDNFGKTLIRVPPEFNRNRPSVRIQSS